MITPEQRDEMRKHVQELRDATNELIDQVGLVMIDSGADDDLALVKLTYMIKSANLTPHQSAAMIAFAVRRLWFKRAAHARTTPN